MNISQRNLGIKYRLGKGIEKDVHPLLILVQQGRNNAPVFKSIKPLFFSCSENYKPGHYFCLDVLFSFYDWSEPQPMECDFGIFSDIFEFSIFTNWLDFIILHKIEFNTINSWILVVVVGLLPDCLRDVEKINHPKIFNDIYYDIIGMFLMYNKKSILFALFACPCICYGLGALFFSEWVKLQEKQSMFHAWKKQMRQTVYHLID